MKKLPRRLKKKLRKVLIADTSLRYYKKAKLSKISWLCLHSDYYYAFIFDVK